VILYKQQYCGHGLRMFTVYGLMLQACGEGLAAKLGDPVPSNTVVVSTYI